MVIQFTKSTGSKPGALKCIRDDGTSTWQHSTPYFAYHDLIHFAVETTLGYTEAFYGLVAAGKGLDDFGTKDGKRDSYTCQAVWAETIVGLLQWPSVAGGVELNDEEFYEQLSAVFVGSSCETPQVSPDQLREMRVKIRELHVEWAGVEAGSNLTVRFTSPVAA